MDIGRYSLAGAETGEHDSAILDIVGQLYEFDRAENLFDWFFPALEKILPMRSAAFIPFTPGTYAFQLQGTMLYKLETESMALFLEKYLSTVPLYAIPATIKTMAPNKAIRVNKMLPNALYKKMPVYQEFFEPLNLHWSMNALLVARNISLGGFALHRREEQGNFNDTEKAIFDRIAPHLARAIHLCCNDSEQHPSAAQDETFREFRLSRRQKEVVQQLLQGRSNQEIAEQLSITEQTVKDHLTEIYRKMSVKSRTQLISLISRNGPF